MTEDDDILFEVRGGVGIVTLNRPQVLNALSFRMTLMLNARLAAWGRDPSVRAVVITGAGEKAFCSGGDVKSVALEAKEGGGVLCSDFFREEYILNHRIHTFPKPYIALVNGIVMGGGKGLSAHGSHRIVNEKTLFAMPETNIGFFPDVGGGYFLPRCPGQTGLYLALTSKRIGAADCLYIVFATHFVESQDFPALLDAVCAEGDIDAAIAKFSKPAPGDPELAKDREAIDRCFAFGRMEEIVAALEREGTEFSRETLKAIEGMSPTSLKVALRQIRLGAGMSFADVMTMEYALSQRLVHTHDFYEGIRAALIDKDRQPKWNPATLGGADNATVEGYFQSLGAQDLVF